MVVIGGLEGSVDRGGGDLDASWTAFFGVVPRRSLRWARTLMRERRGVAQSGSAPVLGTGGRRFKSGRPDFVDEAGSG